jgi:hypothetical protein
MGKAATFGGLDYYGRSKVGCTRVPARFGIEGRSKVINVVARAADRKR